jgi:hypothetical protein
MTRTVNIVPRYSSDRQIFLNIGRYENQNTVASIEDENNRKNTRIKQRRECSFTIINILLTLLPCHEISLYEILN